ncbi:UNVERIFIED_ORG: cell division protein FtsI/penicillin-binding protein 2 [Paenarthrobacter nicotinovorans]
MTIEDPASTTAPTRSRRRPVILVTSIVLAVLVIAIGALVAVNHVAGQQKTESLAALKEQRLNALGDARGKVQPAANAYLAAYKKARNAPASRDQAVQDSQKEKDEFQQATGNARSALQELKSVNGSSESAVGMAVQQLVESHEDYFDYMEGLVESYPQFEGLFRDDDAAGCNGLFVGSKAATLRERQTLLAQAAAPCRKAAAELKDSKNNAYVEFARTFDNNVADLEERAEVTAKGEENYAGFVRLKDDLVKRADEAEARNAPEAEVQKIADDAKAVNAQIRTNRSEFDFAAKRYLAGVKEMPSTVENVFATEIAADIKHFDAVIPAREQILKDTIDVELTNK